MSTETRLKPCPFCGGAAKEYERFNANVITCRKCGVQVRQSEMGQGDAADRWNKRSAPVSAEQVTVPQGWRLVPIDPTDEMLLAGDTHEYDAGIWWSLMLEAAPVAAQPDLTQQTLDDVKAGIPARDAEVEALRKEIETLQDANKADAGQNYNDGFSDGVILALQLMSMHGDYGGTQYCELLSAAGPNQIIERAISEGMWEMSGLSQTPTAVERRAVIDAARKERA